MDKIFFTPKILAIIVLALMVPQVAMAAWWNPLDWFNGWGFLHRIATQAQPRSEEPVIQTKEAEISEVNTSALTGATAKPAQDTSTNIKGNYNSDLLQISDVNITIAEETIKYLRSEIEYVNKVIAMTKDRMDYVESINVYNDEVISIFPEWDRESLGKYRVYVDLFNSNLETAENNLAIAKATKVDINAHNFKNESEVNEKLKFLVAARRTLIESNNTIIASDKAFMALSNDRQSQYMATIRSAKNSMASSNQTLSNPVIIQQYSSPVQPYVIPKVENIHSCSLSPIGGGGVDLIVRCY